MKPLLVKPQKHILVCMNLREGEKDCCKKVGGEELYWDLKKFVRDHGLVGSVWITRTGCLGFCNPVGSTIVIYPEGKWFTEVKMNDLDSIKQAILA